jgi:hypothetical protein
MKNYQRYAVRQRPLMTSRPHHNQTVCPAAYSVWKCTRERYHSERHEAGGVSGRVFASWEEDQ